MTIPQNTLHNIEYKLQCLRKLLEGEYGKEEEVKNIYEICKSIEINVFEFNERMECLEDKMNIIIKLLGKNA